MALRETCRQRVLTQMIAQTRYASEAGSTARNSDFCALLTDDSTLRVLSSCCQVFDTLNAGVSVIELISKSRQALPELDAIYFLSPCAESMEMLARDFKNEKKPQYKSAHVFWATSIAFNPTVMKLAAQPSLLTRIKSFVDFNMHFIAYESRAFHLDMPNALFQLFPYKPGLKDEAKQAVITEIAARLTTVMTTLGDKPNVRFMADSKGLCQAVAEQVQNMMSKLSPEGVSRGQAELIIIDRSIDCATLLVHEYTYQALAYDVLHIPCCTSVTTRQKLPEDVPQDDTYQFLDRNEVQTLVLGEHDDIWVRYRHQHIAIVSKGVSDELKKFSRDNAAAQYAAAGGKKATEKDLASAIRGLPEYREMLTKFWAHITLADSCFQALQQQGVFKAGALEQDLTTGVDKEGKAIAILDTLQLLGSLVPEKSGVSTSEKTRLLLLYFCMIDGVPDDVRSKMMGHAGLSLDMITVINKFLALGLHESDEVNKDKNMNTMTHTHKLHADSQKEKFHYFQKKARDSDYELSRFEPALKDLMDRAAARKLNRGKFPYVQEPEGRPLAVAGGKFGFDSPDEGGRTGKVKATHYEWNWGESSTAAGDGRGPGTDNLAARILDTHSKRVVFFVIGGISMAEMRATYDSAKQSGADIYLGGTAIITPPTLFEALRKSPEDLH